METDLEHLYIYGAFVFLLIVEQYLGISKCRSNSISQLIANNLILPGKCILPEENDSTPTTLRRTSNRDDLTASTTKEICEKPPLPPPKVFIVAPAA